MVSRALVGESQLEASKVLDGPGDEGGGLAPPSFPMKGVEHGHGPCYRVLTEPLGGMRPRVPPAPGSLPSHEVVVAARKARRAKGAKHGQLVGGVVRGAQHREHVSDVLGAPQHGGALEPVGDSCLLERLLERGK
jgi:hypothetical protein